MNDFEHVPGDQLLVHWDDVPDMLCVFIDVSYRNEDDVPVSYNVLTLNGPQSIETDQVIEWGPNIFARTEWVK